MTCIVAFTDSKTVTLGADSCSTNGWSSQIRKDKKLFKCFNGTGVIGFTSSWRMGQLLRFEIDKNLFPAENEDIEQFLICKFIPHLREIARKNGALSTEKGVEELGQFIVGVRGMIFVIEPDFSVSQIACNYAAVGCGQQVAEGSMYATSRSAISAKKQINIALHAAAAHSVGVKPPFHVLSAMLNRSKRTSPVTKAVATKKRSARPTQAEIDAYYVK